MTSITADLNKLTQSDLRELVLKLASQDKSKTLLASAHQLALAILERNRAEQEREVQEGGARYMRLKLSTPLPKVASADLRELAQGEGGLEQYRDKDGQFVYHTGKWPGTLGSRDRTIPSALVPASNRSLALTHLHRKGEAIFFPDSINPDGSVLGRYNWTCCGSDGAISAGCVSTNAVPRDRQMRVLSNMGFMVGLRALPTTPTPGAFPDGKTSYFD
ncbi:uncharacterized protein PG986_012648 [Apiospora aurea]|uniref:Uncharacterized protein n=1 Tax=Apiospora aurea TaxID=335848 RepID=A0ABR1Q0T8_9PEZI